MINVLGLAVGFRLAQFRGGRLAPLGLRRLITATNFAISPACLVAAVVVAGVKTDDDDTAERCGSIDLSNPSANDYRLLMRRDVRLRLLETRRSRREEVTAAENRSMTSLEKDAVKCGADNLTSAIPWAFIAVLMRRHVISRDRRFAFHFRCGILTCALSLAYSQNCHDFENLCSQCGILTGSRFVIMSTEIYARKRGGF